MGLVSLALVHQDDAKGCQFSAGDDCGSDCKTICPMLREFDASQGKHIIQNSSIQRESMDQRFQYLFWLPEGLLNPDFSLESLLLHLEEQSGFKQTPIVSADSKSCNLWKIPTLWPLALTIQACLEISELVKEAADLEILYTRHGSIWHWWQHSISWVLAGLQVISQSFPIWHVWDY